MTSTLLFLFLHTLLDSFSSTLPDLPWLDRIQCGVVGNIQASHVWAPGSIPGVGTFSFFLSLLTLELPHLTLSLSSRDSFTSIFTPCLLKGPFLLSFWLLFLFSFFFTLDFSLFTLTLFFFSYHTLLTWHIHSALFHLGSGHSSVGRAEDCSSHGFP